MVKMSCRSSKQAGFSELFRIQTFWFDAGDGVKWLLQCPTAATATAQVTLSARIEPTQGPKLLSVINSKVKNAQKLIKQEINVFSLNGNMVVLSNTIPPYI